MKINGDKVILRDFIESDIEDRIRWETLETEWLDWDAPWEKGEDIFNSEKYRSRMIKKLSLKADDNVFRYSFQICINDKAQTHIGWINSYNIDGDYCYTNRDGYLTIGIGIPHLNSRRKGYATEAWNLYIKYLFDNEIKDIYTQTWSGNLRVKGLIKKIGFEECYRERDSRIVRGIRYDSLTFKLNLIKFNQFSKLIL